MATAFEIGATLTLDTSQFTNNLQSAQTAAENFSKAAGGAVDSIGDAAGGLTEGKIATAVAKGQALYNAITGVVKGVYSFGEGLVSASADIAAETEQFYNTLGDWADEAEAIFEIISKDTNILSVRLRDEGVKFFTQFKSSSGDDESALQAMAIALSLAADAAADYNMTLEESGHLMRSFIRGNVEAGESIGLFTSGSQRDLAATTLFGSKWAELWDWERQQIFLMQALRNYDDANTTGQAAREKNEWANVSGNFQAAWYQAEGLMGNKLREALIPQIIRLTDWIVENPETFEKLGDSLGKISKAIIDLLTEFAVFLADNSDWLVSLIEGVASTFSKTDPSLEALKGYDIEQYAFMSSIIDARNAEMEKWDYKNADPLLRAYIDDQVDNAMNAMVVRWIEDDPEGYNRNMDLYAAYINAIEEIAAMDSTAAALVEEGKWPEIPIEFLPAEGSRDKIESALNSMGISVVVTPIVQWGADLINRGFEALRKSAEEVSGDFGSAANLMNRGFESAAEADAKFQQMVKDVEAEVESRKGLEIDGSHDTGLSYVPYDGYVAELHRGEGVLTELQNAQYRNTQQEEALPQAGISIDDLIAALWDVFGGLTIQMDKQLVGTIVSPVVFREMGRQLGNKRFAT